MHPNRNWTFRDSALVPHLMGAKPNVTTAVFPENFIIRISYRTEPEALLALLPPGMSLGGDPIVHFVYRHSERLDWVVGGELNMVGISVDATYRGVRDEAVGTYWPALWENDSMAVILGREVFGVAKLCADINNPFQTQDGFSTLLSEGGRPLISIQIEDLQPIEGGALTGIRGMAEKASVLGWKQFPTLDLQKAELGYAIHIPGPIQVEEAWSGVGEVTVYEPNPDENMWTYSIVNTIRALPLVECVGASLTRGSSEHQVGAGRALE